MIIPYQDRATGEYLFNRKWYPDWQSVERAIEAYEEHLAEQYEAEQEERKLCMDLPV